jgi:hypothetical protein
LTGQALQILRGHTSEVHALSITPDGQRAISGSGDKNCIFWDMATGQVLQTLKGHTDFVNVLYITPDGQRAISDSGDKTCILWDLGTGQALQTFKGNTTEAISFTPDGKRVISGSEDNTCILWDLSTGQELLILRGHDYEVHALSISPDGKRAISGSRDKTCILWDLMTGQALHTLRGHTGRINTISITSDGQRAISGSEDNTCILWDLETGKKLAIFTTDSPVLTLKSYFKGILLGCYSGEVIILNADTNLLCPGTAVTTARQIWNFELQKYQELSADCPLCGHRFAPSASVLETIEKITKKAELNPEQSPCLELPKEIWDEPGLLDNCPKCGERLKFNPFVPGKSTLDEKQHEFIKLYSEAESAFNERNWEKAENLYLILMQQGMFIKHHLRHNIAICQINRLTGNDFDLINNINIQIEYLQEEKALDEAKIISDKLNERLSLIKKGELQIKQLEKPWWKRIF